MASKEIKTNNSTFDATNKSFLFLGCGAVAKCTLHFINQFINVDWKKVYIVDQYDQRDKECLKEVFERGAHFLHIHLTDDDWGRVMDLVKLKPNDVVIDLTTDTNAYKVIEAVRKRSLHYLNTAMEINWHFDPNATLYDESLYKRHIEANKVREKISDDVNATHVYEFGMNPGLISHCVFKGLEDIAKEVLRVKPDDTQLAEYLENHQYNFIAKHLGLEVVHCSEIDTQIAKNRDVETEKKFINTWSCTGFLEEGLEPVQMGWGTHEKQIPDKAQILGPNILAIQRPAIKQIHHSWVPDQEIEGVVIPHGEAVTLPSYLSTPDYCPTVHYVYQCCKQAKQMCNKYDTSTLQKLTEYHVLNPFDDDLEGEDRVGALLIFNNNPLTGEKKNWSWWCGTILGQGMDKFHGPTIIQVGAGVLSALKWLLENPGKGPCNSEDVPTSYVFEHAGPYLGNIVSRETPFSPKSTQFVDGIARILE